MMRRVRSRLDDLTAARPYWCLAVLLPLMVSAGIFFLKAPSDRLPLLVVFVLVLFLVVLMREVYWGRRLSRLKSEFRRRGAEFDRLLQGCNDGVWEWDIGSDVIYYAPHLRETMGWQAGNPLVWSERLSTRVHPDDRDRVKSALKNHLERCVPYDLEYRLRTNYGEYRWFRSRGEAEWDVDGLPIRMVGWLTDTTDLKKAAGQLSYLSNLIESSHDAIIGIHLDGSICSWNPAAERHFGYAEEEVIGTDFSRLLHQERRKQVGLLVEQVVTGGRVNLIDTVLRNRDGTGIEVSVSMSPIHDLEGRIVGTAIIARDIGWRREAERKLTCTMEEMIESREALSELTIDYEFKNRELLDARQKAEQANLAKSEFLANMSHEIRTPMTAILGFADVLIREEDLVRAPPHRIDAIYTIKRNGEYLLQLINDILDLSKIESGKVQMERISCSPFQVLSEVESLMRVRADEANLPLVIESEGLIPETILSDPTRLRQILINLVGNAIKFTQRGEVRVRMKLEEGISPQPILRFDVTDTGIGITDDQMSGLFRPFMQADNSTTRKYGGTGLGLTISKRLTEMLGGRLTVESVQSRGSTFSVTIETGDLSGIELLDQSEKVVGKPKFSVNNQREKIDCHGCQVLLAEDGADNQRMISFLLRKAGAEVTVVDNGKEALEHAIARSESEPYDVILMDMQMPVMDGYTATKELRLCGYEAPIIALTAHAMRSDRQKCLDSGCDEYMSKPIDAKKLLRTVADFSKVDTSAESGLSALADR